MVAAPYEQDNSWYRAKVMDVLSDKLDLYFVDYGDSMYMDATLPVPLRYDCKLINPQSL